MIRLLKRKKVAITGKTGRFTDLLFPKIALSFNLTSINADLLKKDVQNQELIRKMNSYSLYE